MSSLDATIAAACDERDALRREVEELRKSLRAAGTRERALAPQAAAPPCPVSARFGMLATIFLILLMLWLQSSAATLPSAVQHLHSLSGGAGAGSAAAALSLPTPAGAPAAAAASPAGTATSSTAPPPLPAPAHTPLGGLDLPSTPSRTPLRSLPRALPSAAPGARTKSAAIVYFGNVGATDYQVKDAMLAGAAEWRMDAAAGARPYIEEHVLAFNAARGWAIDTFLHTWNAGLEGELRALLAPLTNATFGPQELRGTRVTGSMEASVDLALQLVVAHAGAARGGVPYDRLLLLRLDSIFYRGFDLDALVEPDALYIASWCKANENSPLPQEQWPPGVLQCWELKPYWADLEGVPDFWFAGAQAPVLATFEHLWEDLASGAVVKGRTCGGCGHAKVWGALNGHAVKTRRYGFHQIDNELRAAVGAAFPRPPLPHLFHAPLTCLHYTRPSLHLSQPVQGQGVRGKVQELHGASEGCVGAPQERGHAGHGRQPVPGARVHCAAGGEEGVRSGEARP